MEQQLKLKPFEGYKAGVKYRIIRITDITMHASEKRPTSIPKEISRSFQEQKLGRIYVPKKAPLKPEERRKFVIELMEKDPKLAEYLRKEEKKGYKLLIALPWEGIPLIVGTDVVEFVTSVNGQRIIRGLAKEKPSV